MDLVLSHFFENSILSKPHMREFVQTFSGDEGGSSGSDNEGSNSVIIILGFPLCILLYYVCIYLCVHECSVCPHERAAQSPDTGCSDALVPCIVSKHTNNCNYVSFYNHLPCSIVTRMLNIRILGNRKSCP